MSGTTASGTQNTPASWTSARNSSASWAKSLKVYVSTCHPKIPRSFGVFSNSEIWWGLIALIFCFTHKKFHMKHSRKAWHKSLLFLQIPNSMLRSLLFVTKPWQMSFSTLPPKKTPSPLFWSDFASSAFRMECVNCNTWNPVMPGYRLPLWSGPLGMLWLGVWQLAGLQVRKVKKQMEKPCQTCLALKPNYSPQSAPRFRI